MGGVVDLDQTRLVGSGDGGKYNERYFGSSSIDLDGIIGCRGGMKCKGILLVSAFEYLE